MKRAIEETWTNYICRWCGEDEIGVDGLYCPRRSAVSPRLRRRHDFVEVTMDPRIKRVFVGSGIPFDEMAPNVWRGLDTERVRLLEEDGEISVLVFSDRGVRAGLLEYRIDFSGSAPLEAIREAFEAAVRRGR